MESMQEDSYRYLFVMLSFDTLYSINLKDLKNCELETVFSHLTPHKQLDGSSYPLGMGLFVHDSKLHFFGGENLEDSHSSSVNKLVYHRDSDDIELDANIINHYLKKRPKRPKRLSIYQDKKTTKELAAKVWLNKKVFSFTPFVLTKNVFSFTPFVLNDTIAPPDNSHQSSDHMVSQDGTTISINQVLIIPDNPTRRIPDHLGYKVRPIVVTILEKVYVLTTRPFSTSMPKNYGTFGKQVLFEVYDPKKGEWRKLPNPPAPLYREIVGFGVIFDLSISHCVYKNKLLLETQFGQFIFDVITEKWMTKNLESRLYPPILASLEYENILLALVKVELSHELVAFDLASFGEEDCTTSRDYMHILDIEKNEENKSYIFGHIDVPSLNIVENNCFCLVFNAFPYNLHVYLFDVIIEPYSVKAERIVHREFDLPTVLFADERTLSTFVFLKEENVAGQSNESCNGESNYVVVRNLPCTITTSDIRQEFERLKFGEIKPNGVILNRKERLAFVEFIDVQSLNKAIKASPINFGGKEVYIEKTEAVTTRLAEMKMVMG